MIVSHTKGNDVSHFLHTDEETELQNSGPLVLIKRQCQHVYKAVSMHTLTVLLVCQWKLDRNAYWLLLLCGMNLDEQLWNQIYTFIQKKQSSLYGGPNIRNDGSNFDKSYVSNACVWMFIGLKKNLLCKYEDLSLSLQYLHKKPEISSCAFNEIRSKKRKIETMIFPSS